MKTRLDSESIRNLSELSLRVREHIVRMATRGGCFIGASLSCADLLVFLYCRFLKVSSDNLSDPNRDYLFLSKGHDVPALYGLFAEIGFIGKEALAQHLNVNSHIYWHPNTAIPGVEFHSGSLGHLPSVALGVAMDCKMKGQGNKVVVVIGDGELNEGSVWETALVAAAYKMDNLIWVIDRNNFQANVRTEELIPLEPLDRKFSAFGWNVVDVNGHDFQKLEVAFETISHPEKPGVVIARTKRGKGLPSSEERADRWFCNFSEEEVEALLRELHDQQPSELLSETLIVR
jgi:transketolase